MGLAKDILKRINESQFFPGCLVVGMDDKDNGKEWEHYVQINSGKAFGIKGLWQWNGRMSWSAVFGILRTARPYFLRQHPSILFQVIRQGVDWQLQKHLPGVVRPLLLWKSRKERFSFSGQLDKTKNKAMVPATLLFRNSYRRCRRDHSRLGSLLGY